MKISHHHLMLATALASSLAVAVPLAVGPVSAQNNATVPTDPGFMSNGQINTGRTAQAPSQSSDIRKIPTPAEARAALMMPDDPTAALGPEPVQTQTVIGGPIALGASASGARETPGTQSTGGANQDRAGPIGATGQTMPAKLSTRNDILDRVPIMAFPSRLSDQQRQQIYQAVMADKSQPAVGADVLEPASELSTGQALNDMHALPKSVSGIAELKGLKYVKAKDKVLLVAPATRVVVDQITL